MNTERGENTTGADVPQGSRAHRSVRDAQAVQEIASDRIHDAFATLTLDEQARFADSLYNQYAHPTRIYWSSLAFALLVLFCGAFELGRYGDLYDQYAQGAITAGIASAFLYYFWNFVQSVWWRIRTRRESA
jgi:hypothetical protein